MNNQPPANDCHYPIAERNRRAKMRFLAGVKDFYDNKKNAIELRTPEKSKMDLSIPGTPVSSRYLCSLPNQQSKVEEIKKEPAPLPNEIIISSMVIDKFLADMKTLDVDEQHAEISDQITENEKGAESIQANSTTEEYFIQSEQMRMYQRTFSQAVQTLNSTEVKSPLVKRYFEESSAKHSYSRDFDEAFKVLDPTQLPSDQLNYDSATITKGYKTSVPGTPIDSKHLNSLRLHNYISDSSDDENDEYAANDNASNLADPLEKFIRNMEQLNATKYQNTNTANISAEATPCSPEVKQAALDEYFDQSSNKSVCREIDIDQVEEPIEQREHSNSQETIQRNDSLDKLLGKFQPLQVEQKVRNDFCVDSYMNSSDERRTYARTFSEAAQFLHSTDAKNPDIRNYFDESDKIKSFQRGFSAVYQEVGQTYDGEDYKQNEITITRSNAFDGSAAIASESNECAKNITDDISIPGTPINSRKIWPKDKTTPPIEAKPENGADRPEHDKSIPERNGNADREFWKNFGAASL